MRARCMLLVQALVAVTLVVGCGQAQPAAPTAQPVVASEVPPTATLVPPTPTRVSPTTTPVPPTPAPKYLSVLRVVTYTWGAYDSLSWEAAAPIKATADFQWFEATIYPSAPNAVHLYKFDNTFDSQRWFVLSPQDWVSYRESYRLAKVDIPQGVTPEEKSHLLRDAFEQLFEVMVSDTPSQHYGIRYSGHGSGDGSLFERQINPRDARSLLEHATSLIGAKLDFLDLGGNCAEGATAVVSNLYPYFDYILATDLLAGGGYISEDCLPFERFAETDPDHQYPLLMTPDKTIEQGLSQIVDLRRLRWEYCRDNMIAGRINESQTLYRADAFEPLALSVAQELAAHPVALGDYNSDLYTYIKSLGRSDIEEQFLAFRLKYQSNKDFFAWDIDTNGLSIDSAESLSPN